MRNVERAIDISAELVEGKMPNEVGLKSGRVTWIVIVDKVVVSNPGVRAEDRVLEVFVQTAMKFIATAFSNDANLAANRTAILCRIIRSKHLDLLHCIEVRRADRVSAGSNSHRNRAVVSQQVVALAASIDIECAEPCAEAEARHIAGDTRNTGLGEREINGISAVERQVVGLATRNNPAKRRAISL